MNPLGSTRNSTDVCTLAPEAPKSTKDDGEDRIELSDAPSQTNTGLSAQLFGSAVITDANPFLDYAVRAVDPVTLADGLTLEGGAKTRFDDAYIVDGTWVSGGNSSDVVLPLIIGSATFRRREFDLVIHHAVITFTQGAPGGAAAGTIAGVLNVEEAAIAARPLAAVGDCKVFSNDAIADRVRMAADMMSDGTNVCDPTLTAAATGWAMNSSDPCCTPSWPLNWPAK